MSRYFRIELDLYAHVRPARARPLPPSNMREGRSMDLVIMREATEGFYPDRNMTRGWGEMMPSPDMALSIRKITRRASERPQGDHDPQGQQLPHDGRASRNRST